MKGREEQLGNLHLNIYKMIPPSSRSEKLSREKHKLPTDGGGTLRMQSANNKRALSNSNASAVSGGRMGVAT